jgi:hypothetical protein
MVFDLSNMDAVLLPISGCEVTCLRDLLAWIF